MSHIWPLSGRTKDCLQLTAVEVRAYPKKENLFLDKKVSMPLDFYLLLSLLPFVSIPPPPILFSIFLILEVSEFSARKQLES